MLFMNGLLHLFFDVLTMHGKLTLSMPEQHRVLRTFVPPLSRENEQCDNKICGTC